MAGETWAVASSAALVASLLQSFQAFSSVLIGVVDRDDLAVVLLGIVASPEFFADPAGEVMGISQQLGLVLRVDIGNCLLELAKRQIGLFVCVKTSSEVHEHFVLDAVVSGSLLK